MILSLVATGLLALLGDQSGRAVGLVFSLVSFLALIVDLTVMVGILSYLAIQNHSRFSNGETEIPLEEDEEEVTF